MREIRQKALSLERFVFHIPDFMKKQLLIDLALMLGGQLPAAQAQATLAGDHQVNGNFTISDPNPTPATRGGA